MTAIGIFVSCNIDGLLLLMVLLCTPAFTVRSVFVGQFLSQAILILISMALSHLALRIAPTYIGLVGLLPFSLGVWKLLARPKSTSEEPRHRPESTGDWGPCRAVAWTTALAVSNGGDNLSVYVPVFAARAPAVLAMSISFLLLSGIWCLLAWYLARHLIVGRFVERYSRTLLPWNMIALGVYVLSGSVPQLLPRLLL